MFVDSLSVGGAPMKQIALLSFFAILALVAFALNTAPASDRGATAQINTQELTLNAKNLVDNTVTEPSRRLHPISRPSSWRNSCSACSSRKSQRPQIFRNITSGLV